MIRRAQRLAGIGAILMAAIILLVAACKGDGKPSPPASPSLEYKLATINADHPVEVDDPLVAEFGAVLDNLEAKCPEVRAAIANMAATAWEELGKQRSDAKFSLLHVMQNVYELLPADLGERFCFEFFQQYSADNATPQPTPTPSP